MTLLRDTIKLYGSGLILIPVGLALTIVSARVLGPELRGTMTAAYLVPNFALIFANLGMPTAGNYLISREKVDPRAVSSTLLWSGFAVGCLIAVALLVAFALFPTIGFPEVSLGQQAIVLLALPLSLPSTFLGNLYLIRRWYGRKLVVGALRSLLRIAAILSVVYLFLPGDRPASETITGLLIATSVAALALTAIEVAVFRAWALGKPSWQVARRMLTFGWWTMFGTGAMYLLHFGDQYLLPKLRGESGMAELGIYTAAYGMFLHAMSASRSLSTAFFQKGLELDREGADQAMAELVRRGVPVLALGAGMLALIAEPVIVFLLGTEFKGAAVPLAIMGIAAPAYFAGEILSNAAFNRAKTIWSAVPAVIGLVANILLNLLWIPQHGMIGCAWATTIAFWVMLVVRWVIFARLSGLESATLIFKYQANDLAFYRSIVIRVWRGVRSRLTR